VVVEDQKAANMNMKKQSC